MLKVNELLDRTGKVISSAAAISLGLAVIAVSAVVVKENVKELLSLRKIKAHVICVKSSGDIPEAPKKEAEAPVEKEAPKPAPKKGSSKKSVSEPAPEEVKESKPAAPEVLAERKETK